MGVCLNVDIGEGDGKPLAGEVGRLLALSACFFFLFGKEGAAWDLACFMALFVQVQPDLFSFFLLLISSCLLFKEEDYSRGISSTSVPQSDCCDCCCCDYCCSRCSCCDCCPCCCCCHSCCCPCCCCHSCCCSCCFDCHC